MNFVKIWYNYRTKSRDFLSAPPSNYEDYIPQSPESINMYRLYLEIGESPARAARNVLRAYSSENNLTPTPDAATI